MATKKPKIPTRLVNEFGAHHHANSSQRLVLNMTEKEAIPMDELLTLKDELKGLQLANCEMLQGFPAEFSQLKCLRGLDVFDAERLSRIPEGILSLEQLEVW